MEFKKEHWPVWILWCLQIVTVSFFLALCCGYFVAAIVYCIEHHNAVSNADLPQIVKVIPAEQSLGIVMREESEESNPDPAAVAKWEETWKSRWAMPFASTTLLVLVVICLTTAFHWSTERTLTCILLPLLLLGGLLSYLTALEPAVESLDQLHCGASLVFWIIAAVVAFFSFGFLIYSIEHEFEDLQKALKTASNPAPVEPPRKPKRDPVQDAPVAE